MKKQLLILGLVLGCGLQVQAGKKVLPAMPRPVDKDLLHVGLELKKAMNSDVFKKQLKAVVAQVFKQANLSPSQIALTRASLSHVAKAMNEGYENFEQQRHVESPEIAAINKQLEPLQKQLDAISNDKEYQELQEKVRKIAGIAEYRKQNFDWNAESKNIKEQIVAQFPEYAKLDKEMKLIEKELEPYNIKQKKLSAEFRELIKQEGSLQPEMKKADEQKSQQVLQEELAKWPVREIFKLDDAKVFFEHMRLIVNAALQTLNQMPVSKMVLPKQTPEEVKQDMIEAGLNIKRALTADSVKQKIQKMVTMAVKQADINVDQAKKSYNSLMMLSQALQQGVDVFMPTQRRSVELSPEAKTIYDELDKLRKQSEPMSKKSWELRRKIWNIKDADKEMSRLYKVLKEKQEQELKAKFSEYAQIKDQLKPYEEKRTKITKEQYKLWVKIAEVRTKKREAQKQPQGREVLEKEMRAWPFEQIVQIPNDFGIILEHARLIIAAAGSVLERKARSASASVELPQGRPRAIGPKLMPTPERVTLPAVQ